MNYKKIIGTLVIFSIFILSLSLIDLKTYAISSPNRIIHISDLHFSDHPITLDGTEIDIQYSIRKSNEISDYIISHKYLLGSDTVVITGDVTDSGDQGDYDLARKFVEKLESNGFKVYLNPGNHDYFKEGTILLGKDPNRRTRFINELSHYSDYPHVISLGSTVLIMLDSVKAEMDEDTGDDWGQGKFGADQLSKLKQLVDSYQTARKNGVKVVVALHHNPFEAAKGSGIMEATTGLHDSEEFLSIIQHEIDGLLYGHMTPDGEEQVSPTDKETAYGIPLINCENLEHMSNGYMISVMDLNSWQIEVYRMGDPYFVHYCKRSDPNMLRITPNVTKNQTKYDFNDSAPTVKFQTGDIVTLTIGGGAQTGGGGSTWKRFVNPSGSNSDRLYYGQIYIPGITNGLTPIRDLVPIYGSYDKNSPDKCTLKITIPKIDSIPENDRYLILGYVDDNYSDNGYWGHDDGTEDQCKNVGDAYVDVNLNHSSQGTFLKQYNISPPIVNSSNPINYNGTNGKMAVEFKTGDKVTIIAGGGVQTGGSGNTWKRYVNPSGSDSDRLYFGKIYIPGITKGLTPIRDLVSKYGSYDSQFPDKCQLTFTIPDINNLPQNDRYLTLHYIDDGYGDNGYWGHDNGTEDQCKDVYEAYVVVKVGSEQQTISPDLIVRNSAGDMSLYTFKNNILNGPSKVGNSWNFTDYLVGNWTGDGTSDMIVRNSSGEMWLYPFVNNTFYNSIPTKVGDGFNYTNYFVGDWTGDGTSDLIVRNSNGEMWLYVFRNSKFLSPVKVGNAWNFTNYLVGNWTGDGTDDMIAVNKAGEVWLYPFRNNTFYGNTPVKLGDNFDFTDYLVGNWTDDGTDDIIARNKVGEMWLYSVKNNKFEIISRVGNGWNFMNYFVGYWTGDGTSDLMVRNTSGELWVYPFRNNTFYGNAPIKVGSGSYFSNYFSGNWTVK